MRSFICLLYFIIAGGISAMAQQYGVAAGTDTTKHFTRIHRPITVLDSVANAIALEEKSVSDSLSLVYIIRPDSNRTDLFVDSLVKSNAYNGNHYLDISAHSTSKMSVLGYGHVRPARDPWVIIVIITLLLFIALLNIYSSKDMSNVFLAFYNKRGQMQTGKEDSPINTWTFIGLFLLFGFTFGIFLYLLTTGYYKVYYTVSGMQLFLTLSFVIIALFATKFFALKFLGFVFDIKKLVGDYITALSLTYFNITFVFLPVALCFSLISEKFIPYLLAVTLVLSIVIFIWQYLRSSVSIISNFQFHKFYLFIYLCALEICPILILVKALNIGFK